MSKDNEGRIIHLLDTFNPESLRAQFKNSTSEWILGYVVRHIFQTIRPQLEKKYGKVDIHLETDMMNKIEQLLTTQASWQVKIGPKGFRLIYRNTPITPENRARIFRELLAVLGEHLGIKRKDGFVFEIPFPPKETKQSLVETFSPLYIVNNDLTATNKHLFDDLTHTGQNSLNVQNFFALYPTKKYEGLGKLSVEEYKKRNRRILFELILNSIANYPEKWQVGNIHSVENETFYRQVKYIGDYKEFDMKSGLRPDQVSPLEISLPEHLIFPPSKLRSGESLKVRDKCFITSLSDVLLAQVIGDIFKTERVTVQQLKIDLYNSEWRVIELGDDGTCTLFCIKGALKNLEIKRFPKGFLSHIKVDNQHLLPKVLPLQTKTPGVASTPAVEGSSDQTNLVVLGNNPGAMPESTPNQGGQETGESVKEYYALKLTVSDIIKSDTAFEKKIEFLFNYSHRIPTDIKIRVFDELLKQKVWILDKDVLINNTDYKLTLDVYKANQTLRRLSRSPDKALGILEGIRFDKETFISVFAPIEALSKKPIFRLV